MNHNIPAYGLWSLVVINSAIFILFAFSFFKPKSGAWRVLYREQQEDTLATAGPYAHIRHPQYVAFMVIMFGFLVQWPTFVTLVMFPVLVTVYVKLARREEREVRDRFGLAWHEYAARTPAFFPRLRGGSHTSARVEHAHA